MTVTFAASFRAGSIKGERCRHWRGHHGDCDRRPVDRTASGSCFDLMRKGRSRLSKGRPRYSEDAVVSIGILHLSLNGQYRASCGLRQQRRGGRASGEKP